MEAVAAEPKTRHGRSPCQAEGAEPAWMLSKASDYAVGTARPAGEAPWCCQFSVQPGVVFERQPAVQFGLDQVQHLCFALLVLRLRQAAPVTCWGEHAGNQGGLPLGRTPIALAADGDEQRPWGCAAPLEMAWAGMWQCITPHRSVKHQRTTRFMQVVQSLAVPLGQLIRFDQLLQALGRQAADHITAAALVFRALAGADRHLPTG